VLRIKLVCVLFVPARTCADEHRKSRRLAVLARKAF